MRLADAIRRWWRPAQWADDHPEDAAARLEKRQRSRSWWREAQSLGGRTAWGRVNVERDFKKPRRY